MDLKLNFFGMHVSDFAPSFRFYTETLGINATDTKIVPFDCVPQKARNSAQGASSASFVKIYPPLRHLSKRHIPLGLANCKLHRVVQLYLRGRRRPFHCHGFNAWHWNVFTLGCERPVGSNEDF